MEPFKNQNSSNGTRAESVGQFDQLKDFCHKRSNKIVQCNADNLNKALKKLLFAATLAFFECHHWHEDTGKSFCLRLEQEL